MELALPFPGAATIRLIPSRGGCSTPRPPLNPRSWSGYRSPRRPPGPAGSAGRFWPTCSPGTRPGAYRPADPPPDVQPCWPSGAVVRAWCSMTGRNRHFAGLGAIRPGRFGQPLTLKGQPPYKRWGPEPTRLPSVVSQRRVGDPSTSESADRAQANVFVSIVTFIGSAPTPGQRYQRQRPRPPATGDREQGPGAGDPVPSLFRENREDSGNWPQLIIGDSPGVGQCGRCVA